MVCMQIPIPIPQTGECLLKEEQEVTFNTPFVKTQKQIEIALPVAEKLHIHPSKIFTHLRKFVGDDISVDEIIAEKKSIFGRAKFKSPYKGVVKEIDHVKGHLLIETRSEDKDTVPCWFHGKVVKVEEREIFLKVHKGAHFEIQKTDHYFGGHLYVFDHSHTSFADVEDKIIVARTISAYEQTKFEAMGAAGFVTSQKLSDNSFIPTAILKDQDDITKIEKVLHPYCLIEHMSSKMYIYE